VPLPAQRRRTLELPSLTAALRPIGRSTRPRVCDRIRGRAIVRADTIWGSHLHRRTRPSSIESAMKAITNSVSKRAQPNGRRARADSRDRDDDGGRLVIGGCLRSRVGNVAASIGRKFVSSYPDASGSYCRLTVDAGVRLRAPQLRNHPASRDSLDSLSFSDAPAAGVTRPPAASARVGVGPRQSSHSCSRGRAAPRRHLSTTRPAGGLGPHRRAQTTARGWPLSGCTA
jgi:hypothetical protein